MSAPDLLRAVPPLPGSRTAPPNPSPLHGPHPQAAPFSHPPARKPRRSGRVVRIACFAGLVVMLGYGAFRWGLPTRKGPDAITAVAARGNLVITVTDRGDLESSKSTNILCEIEGGGKLATIVPEGTRVKKGDEVAKFDMDSLTKAINEQEVKWETADGKMKAARSDRDAQKDKAASEIGKAEAALVLAKIDYESYKEGEYEVELEKRRGAVELSRKDLKEAEDGLEFTRGLAKKGFTQLEQIRVKELEVEAKRYDVKQKEADLNVLIKFTKKRKETELKSKSDEATQELARTKKIQAAATEKAESEARASEKTAELEKKQLERIRQQLEKCVVKAPQDGIVIYAKRYYWDDNSEVRPGAQLHFQQPIITLPDLDKMQVKLRVHESVVKKVQKGQSATMQMDALAGKVLNGKVVAVATQAQSAGWRSSVKEYETTVSVDDLPADAGLRPGMTAEVKILLKTVPDALTVPVQAVTEFDGKHIAYVVTAGGLERREVKVGDSNDQLVQILEGVTEGERVALDARMRAAAELKAGEGKDKVKKDDADKKKDGGNYPVTAER